MVSIHITNSFQAWEPSRMKLRIRAAAKIQCLSDNPEKLLNRSYRSMYFEWWLHNIVYYVTLPFTKNVVVQEINLRCKDVDLEEWE